MTLSEIQIKLKNLNKKGFVKSLRKGPTGIGFTLEKELNLKENNLSIPDIGGRVELKATRKNSNSLITLFTFNKSVWQFPQKEIIEKYGYIDENNRLSLYNTVNYLTENTQKLIIQLDEKNYKVNLVHHPTNIILATWNLFVIIGKFVNKIERLLFVLADSKIDSNNKEEFHYLHAYFLSAPQPNNFLKAFKTGNVLIDLRMHLKKNGVVRNHGTGFRIFEKNLDLLYNKKKILL